MNNDIRNLTKWLNEDQEAPLDRQALARVLAMAEQPAVSAGPITPAMMQGPTPEQKSQMVAAMSKLAEQPAQQQEPVAWICEGSSSDEKHAIDYWPGNVDDLPIGTQLYTSPPAQRTWVGLTNDEISEIAINNLPMVHEFVRAIEAKLREKNT